MFSLLMDIEGRWICGGAAGETDRRRSCRRARERIPVSIGVVGGSDGGGGTEITPGSNSDPPQECVRKFVISEFVVIFV